MRRSTAAKTVVIDLFEEKAKLLPISPIRPGVNKPKAIPNNTEFIDFEKLLTDWQWLKNICHLTLCKNIPTTVNKAAKKRFKGLSLSTAIRIFSTLRK